MKTLIKKNIGNITIAGHLASGYVIRTAVVGVVIAIIMNA